MKLMESGAVRARELRRLELLDDAARERMMASASVPRAKIPASACWMAWISAVRSAMVDLATRLRVAQVQRSIR